ncbi:MAG: hypothetical protein VCB25_05185, partial [Myxococcota bacterium]
MGGWVRDQLNHQPSKDLDLEIFGLSREQIAGLLSPYGFSAAVGQHFPVWRQTRAGIDVAFPRAGNETGETPGADSLGRAFRLASRHRDLTLNAIGWDPISQQLLDPYHGQKDLEDHRLRAVCAKTFGSDPLRVLRVARLHARLEAAVDPALAKLCRELDLGSIPTPRLAGELRRILSQAKQPSKAFEFLVEIDQLSVFGPVGSLHRLALDFPEHRSSEAFSLTLKVLDAAVLIAIKENLSNEAREQLMLAALCHNFGWI